MAVLKGFEPTSFGEQKTLQYLKRNLPDSFTIYHNIEITLPGNSFEVDALIVSPMRLYVVEVKGTHGEIEIDLHNWYSDGVPIFASPLKKLREHTRKLKGYFRDSLSADSKLRELWFQSCVILPNTTSRPGAKGADNSAEVKSHLKQIVCLSDAKAFFTRCRPDDIPHTEAELETIHQFLGKYIDEAKRSYRDWVVSEQLPTVSAQFTEFLVHRRDSRLTRAKLRAYKLERIEDTRGKMMLRLLRNQLELSTLMSGHRNLINIREAFIDDDGDEYAVVSDNVNGRTLAELLEHNELEIAQKTRIITDVLSGLAHAHESQVIHRNLTPKAIILDESLRARVGNFEFGGFLEQRPSTVQDLLVYLPESKYTAPEFYKDGTLNELSDIFRAGVIFYELLTGKAPFDGSEPISERDWTLPATDKLSADMYAWLSKLCALEPGERNQSASTALDEFREIAKREPLSGDSRSTSEPCS